MTLSKAILEMNKIIKLWKVEDKKNDLERYFNPNAPRLNNTLFVRQKYSEYIAPYLDNSALTTICQITTQFQQISGFHTYREFTKVVNTYGYFSELEINSLYLICNIV